NGAIDHIITTYQQKYPGITLKIALVYFNVSKTADHLFLASDKGTIIWGDVHSGNNRELTDTEILLGRIGKQLISDIPGNKQPFFQPCQSPKEFQELFKQKWLTNTVINTLCAAYNLKHTYLALEDQARFSMIMSEAYALGHKLWGPWSSPLNTLQEQIISLINDLAFCQNSMYRHVQEGKKTESDYLAGKALDFHEFSLLTELHQQITAHHPVH
ncbi:MAG: hypothetical protein OXC40_05940, partial [Proteobacteria bacterium]|nr:hypothetical protein [Pseudomonadota bacterium]